MSYNQYAAPQGPPPGSDYLSQPPESYQGGYNNGPPSQPQGGYYGPPPQPQGGYNRQPQGYNGQPQGGYNGPPPQGGYSGYYPQTTLQPQVVYVQDKNSGGPGASTGIMACLAGMCLCCCAEEMCVD